MISLEFILNRFTNVVSTKGKFSFRKVLFLAKNTCLAQSFPSFFSLCHFVLINITSLERKSKINWNWKINVDNFIFQVQFISGFLSYEVIFEGQNRKKKSFRLGSGFSIISIRSLLSAFTHPSSRFSKHLHLIDFQLIKQDALK